MLRKVFVFLHLPLLVYIYIGVYCWEYMQAQVDEAVDITWRTMNSCVVCKILSI